MSSLKRKNSEEIDDLPHADNRLNSRWINDELQLAIKGFRKYGKDFTAIAEMLGTKTDSQVRTFYLNSRRKYSLDTLIDEFERDVRAQQQVSDGDDDGADRKDGIADGSDSGTDTVACQLASSNEESIVAKQSDDDIMEVSFSYKFWLF